MLSIIFSQPIIAQPKDKQLKEIDILIKEQKDSLALSKLNIFLETAKQNKDTLTLIKIYDLYADYFSEDSSLILKRFLLQKSLLLKSYYNSHPQNKNLLEELYNTYKNLGILYEKSREIYTAIDLYFRMAFIGQQIEAPKMEAEAYKLIANAYYYDTNFKKAEEFYNKSLNVSQQINDTLNIIETLFGLGLLNYNSGAYSNALSYFYEAQNLASQSSDNQYNVIINIYLAKIFYDLNNWEQAQEYSSKAIFIINTQDKTNFSPLNAGMSNMISGLAQYQQKNYSQALSYFLAAQKYFLNTKATGFIIKNEAYLGLTYMYLEEYEKAKQYFTKALLLSQKTGKKNDFLEASIAYARYYLKTDDIPKAKALLTQALEIAKKCNALPKISEITNLLYQIYKGEGNYKAALNYLEQFLDVTGQMHRENAIINAERIKVEQQYRQNTQIMQQKVELIKKEKENLIIFSSLLLILLLLIILLTIFFLRKNKTISRQKNLIEKQKEIILKQYEQYKLLSLVASHTENSIFILDSNLKIIWVNEALLRLYKTDYTDIFSISQGDFKKLTHYDINKIYESCFVLKKTITYVSKITFEDEEKWIQTSLTPIIENDEVDMLIGIESDITELKKAEEEISKQKKDIETKNRLMEVYNKELKEQKEAIITQNEELRQQQEELQAHMELLEEYNRELHRLSVIASETDSIIYIFDIKGNLIWANKAFTKYTGYTLAEFKDKIGGNILTASTINNIEFYFYTCIEQKKSISYISQFETKYGKTLWLQTMLSPIKDKEGNVIEIVAIDSDISEIKEAEQKIAMQNNEIKSSLEYAGRIQRSVLPLPIFINAIFEKYFIYNKPRDIVSGDFYFVHYQNDMGILALSDCTGHGIPGALLSILGTLAFKIVMSKTNSYNPAIILKLLNTEIIKLLHQRGAKDESFDSIDTALCVFDFKNDTVEYSGANIPMFLARLEDEKYTINRIKPNKATIGYDMLTTTFTVHSFKLNKGDRIYLSSDGIADQFGGLQNKKLKRKGFVSMLEQISQRSIEEQYEATDQFLREWMGANEQIDDMLLVGIEY